VPVSLQNGSSPDGQTVRLRPKSEAIRASHVRAAPTRKTSLWKYLYWRWKNGELWGDIRERIGAKKIDLRRTLIGGDGVYKDLSWSEIRDDLPRASTLLADSAHVKLLLEYQAVGEPLFHGRNFERTEYYWLGQRWVRLAGEYFGQQDDEGLRAHARAFVTLYERIKNGDWTEVPFPSKKYHSASGSLPVVRATLTPGTFQIVEGHHRLSIYWALGRRNARVTVLPAVPTELQSLVLAVAQNQVRRQLCQPIDRLEFDQSWKVQQPCEKYLAGIIQVLSQRGIELRGLSVLNLGCLYGWYVAALAARGCQVIGVDPDPAALKIARLAYALPAGQLAQSDLPAFFSQCQRTFDVVFLTGGWYDLAQRGDSRSLPEVLRRADVVTRRCLFVDTAPTYEPWWRKAFPGWGEDALVNFLKQQTAFAEVVPLGNKGSSGGARNKHTGTLLACTRLR